MKTNFKTSVKFITFCLASTTLVACEQKAATSGALPAITAPPYEAPTNQAAKQAYLLGFNLRYKVPVLEYPPEIAARVKAAKMKKLKRNKKLFQMNMKLARKAVDSGVLGDLTGPDKQYADIIRGFGKGSEITPKKLKNVDEGVWKFLADTAMMEHTQTNRVPDNPVLRNKQYDAAVKAYPRTVRYVNIDNCRWKEMPILHGGNFKDMGVAYGQLPTHGYSCRTEIMVSKTAKMRGNPIDGMAFFVKSAQGKWLHFGGHPRVGVSPRRIQLHPQIMANPEKAASQLPFWEMDI